jgi:hypothetical protein
MIGMNAYVATKAALEAHSVNLAAEVAESGRRSTFRRYGGDRPRRHPVASADPTSTVIFPGS